MNMDVKVFEREKGKTYNMIIRERKREREKHTK
jgi:hypothetical protein